MPTISSRPLRRTAATLSIAMIVAALALSVPARAGSSGRTLVTILNVLPRSLLTLDVRTVHARVDSPVAGITFTFEPQGGDPVTLGTDRVASEPAMGPGCARSKCVRKDEYSVAITKALLDVPEGWGTLTAYVVDDPSSSTSVQAYWDGTPPMEVISKPRFGAVLPPGETSFKVIAHSSDENLSAVKVFWQLADATSRGIPTYEQHNLGALLSNGGHASCAPTSMAANMEWLEEIGRGSVGISTCGWLDLCLVTNLGQQMGTSNSGTTGYGAVYGTWAYLQSKGFDYPADYYVDDQGSTGTGFPPEKLVELFQDDFLLSAVSVGLHNMPGDPKFGHVLALDDVVMQPNGEAKIRLMDPHLSPPGMQGVYRWFTLHQNGTVDWDYGTIGYYDPPSGKVRLDEILRLLLWPKDAADVHRIHGDGGEVPGRLRADGTWVGTFTPPPGSSGPWLLRTESTDAAGQTQFDFQFIGEHPEHPPEGTDAACERGGHSSMRPNRRSRFW